MTAKKILKFPKRRNLSSKKEIKSIAIPESLNDWISRFLEWEKDKEYDNIIPKEQTSFSGFISYVMEIMMDLLSKGHSLEDISRMPDKKISEFYDKITFRALIDHYEKAVSLYKYVDKDFDKLFNLIMLYKSFIVPDKPDVQEATEIMDRFRTFMISNNTTTNVIVEKISGENRFSFQYFGKYENMHYDFSKIIAAIMGVLGAKIYNIEYSENYCKFYVEITNLFYRKEYMQKERRKLLHENVKYLTNMTRIVSDSEPIHTWLALYSNELVQLSFNDKDGALFLIKETIDKMISNNSIGLSIKYLILKLFESFRWISIIDKERYIIEMLLTDIHKLELEIFLQALKENNMKLEKKGPYFILE